jgi:hypothetical protein
MFKTSQASDVGSNTFLGSSAAIIHERTHKIRS